MRQYPEHEKLKVVAQDSQKLADFLDWIESRHWCVAEYVGERMYPVRFGNYRPAKDSLLAEYFEIDLKKIDKEKDQMLEEMRESHIQRRKST
jgi:hypothetical protein